MAHHAIIVVLNTFKDTWILIFTNQSHVTHTQTNLGSQTNLRNLQSVNIILIGFAMISKNPIIRQRPPNDCFAHFWLPKIYSNIK